MQQSQKKPSDHSDEHSYLRGKKYEVQHTWEKSEYSRKSMGLESATSVNKSMPSFP